MLDQTEDWNSIDKIASLFTDNCTQVNSHVTVTTHAHIKDNPFHEFNGSLYNKEKRRKSNHMNSQKQTLEKNSKRIPSSQFLLKLLAIN